MPSAVRTAKKKKESFTQGQLTPPNREFITLTLTRLSTTYKTANGKNETLTMEKKSDEEFTVTQRDTGVRWNNKKAEIVETERERLQVLHTMLRGGNIHNLEGKENILEVYGIEMRRFTPEEEQLAKKLLKRQAGKFVRGWRVINKRTEKDFLSFCSKEHLSENHGVDYLFHGSKHQNWWSILTNGLTINPLGVVITGKAYGQGTYFAPDAIKSLGYTSKADAKYGGGHESTGFMAIYKVATGNRYDGRLGTDGQLSWEKLQKIQPGAHCTWAECRYSGFQMDEVIVYRNEQSTIWGLLELAM